MPKASPLDQFVVLDAEFHCVDQLFVLECLVFLSV